MTKFSFYIRQYNIFISVLVTAFIMQLPCFAQIYSLNEVLNRIEQNNPSVQAFENRITSINEKANGANAWMPPKAETEWDMLPYNLDYTNGSWIRTSVMQDIPNFKMNEAKRKYILSMTSTEGYKKDYYKTELFSVAKATYHKIYVAQKRINILAESDSVLKLMISLATKQMAITKGGLPTIYRLKAKLSENELMITEEQNMISSYIVNLDYLMNEDVNHVFSIDTFGLIKDYRGLSTFLKIDSIECKRSDIMRMNSEINTMKLNKQMMLLQSRPEFSLKASNYKIFGGMPNAIAIMGAMTIPSVPWSARGYKSEAKSMDYVIESMEQDKKNMANMALQMIKMYRIELETGYKELDDYTSVVIPAYKQSLDANLLAYGQNTADLTMALMAWDDLLMAQMEYMKRIDNYLKVQTDYETVLQIR